MQNPRKVPLFPVLLVNFIGMLGYSIVIPLLVFLVERFGGNALTYGILGSVYPAFQLLGAPILGRWSDRIGRRRVLLISQFGTFLAWVLFITALLLPVIDVLSLDNPVTGRMVLTLPLFLLFLARALDGLTGGNVSVANAYLADISTPKNRKKNFGKLASSTSLGFIIGPVLAGLLGATFLGELLPVLAAALISLIAMIVIYRYLPESRPELVDPDANPLAISKLFQIEHKECYEMKHCPESAGLSDVLRIPGIPVMFLINFLTFLGFSFFYAGFPVFASGHLGWSPSQLGLFFTISSAIMVLVQGPVLSRLSRIYSDRKLVLAGSVFLTISFLIIPQATWAAVYTGNVFLAIGNGLMWPSFLSILSGKGSKDMQGTIQGYANSSGSLASIFGLVLGGLLFSSLGPNVFYLAAIIMFLIFLASLGSLPASGQVEPGVTAAEG